MPRALPAPAVRKACSLGERVAPLGPTHGDADEALALVHADVLVLHGGAFLCEAKVSKSSRACAASASRAVSEASS
jgi:hypothetical protein